MWENKYSTFIKLVITILICSILYSCSASTHYGIVTIAEPSKNETDTNQWFLYYQDQLDATGGKTQSPSSDYPVQARQGYQKALEDWKLKVGNRSSTFTPVIFGVIIISIYFIVKELSGVSSSSIHL